MKYSEIDKKELIGKLIFDIDSETYLYFLALEKNDWYVGSNYKCKAISIYIGSKDELEFDINLEKSYIFLDGEFEFVEEFPLKERIKEVLKLIL